MLVGGVSTSYTLLLGIVLVLVMSRGDLLIGSLITFCFFLFSLGSWYHFFTSIHPQRLAVLHPQGLEFLHPQRFVLRFMLLFFCSGILGFLIASVLVVLVGVWFGIFAASSGKVSD